MTIIHWIVIFLLFYFGPTRCLIFHLPQAIYYAVKDIYTYIKEKKWQDFKYYGIHMFVGMFGHGKTLSMSMIARLLYKRYGDTIRYVSNYDLKGIPYIPLKNFNQIVDLGKEAIESEKKSKYLSKDELEEIAQGLRSLPPYYLDSKGNVKKIYRRKVKIGKDEKGEPIYERKILRPVYKGTVVLISEIEALLSHRSYASFPLAMLNSLCQQRKAKIFILCDAQRYFMVDKIWRSITTWVIDCNKAWRLQHMEYYDAWDYENAMNVQLIKRHRNKWRFIYDKDYNSYDTTQMISQDMSKDFISNDEQLTRIGLDNMVNSDAVNKPSKKLKKARKHK